MLFALVWIAAAAVGVGLYVQLSSSLGGAVVVIGSALLGTALPEKVIKIGAAVLFFLFGTWLLIAGMRSW